MYALVHCNKCLFYSTGTDGATPVATVGTTGAGCCPGNCYPDSCAMFPLFNVNLASQLVTNYRNNHWKKINNYVEPFKINDGARSDTVDARSCWFDLQALKAFINSIETNTCMNNHCPDVLRLGIRIYYGEYPTDNTLLQQYGTGSGDPVDPLYAGMHTLLMVPTYYDYNRQVDVDFDPVVFSRSSCSDPIISIFDTVTSVPSMLAMAPNINSRNHGGLMPPPYKFADYWQPKGGAFSRYVDYIKDQVQGVPTDIRMP
jgi:hypothetical protein